MKISLTCVLLTLTLHSYSQVPNLKPRLGPTLDFSPEVVAKFNSPEKLEECKRIYKKLDAERRNPTPSEEKILNSCDETKDGIWKTIGGGCGYYCLAGPSEIVASSTLGNQGSNNYQAENAHDFSYKTAWVEGKPDYGIGEYLIYSFPSHHPPISNVIVVNGYVKSESAWINNSRVKKLNMYVNNNLYAYLHLDDVRANQNFSIPKIDNSIKKSNEVWTIKFEIAEVYEGQKYSDVAITEIFFDGSGVHCFASGTQILMANGIYSSIENLEIGQEVLSMNSTTGEFESSKILELASPIHDNLVELLFADGRIIKTTEDHPFFNGKTWISLNPKKTLSDYNFDNISQLEIGMKVRTLNGNLELVSINKMPYHQRTYTIVKLNRNNSFIANGIVVGTEELRIQNYNVACVH